VNNVTELRDTLAGLRRQLALAIFEWQRSTLREQIRSLSSHIKWLEQKRFSTTGGIQ
jgi:hypothetical protein